MMWRHVHFHLLSSHKELFVNRKAKRASVFSFVCSVCLFCCLLRAKVCVFEGVWLVKEGWRE